MARLELGEVDDDEVVAEWKLRAIAPPVALGLAALFRASGVGHWVQRTVLSMPIHELGHAITGWLCGFNCVPTVWKTTMPEARGVIAPLLVCACWAALVWFGARTRRPVLVGIGAVLSSLQLVGTLLASNAAAHAVITFAGDGGAMVLGSLLVCTFFAPRASKLVRNGLRWGFLVIGSAAYIDVFGSWLAYRRHPDTIPYGVLENIGPSDPSLLTDRDGWREAVMIHRYVLLGVVCAVALVAIWALAVRASVATRRR